MDILVFPDVYITDGKASVNCLQKSVIFYRQSGIAMLEYNINKGENDK
jgi:hypothetical protein